MEQLRATDGKEVDYDFLKNQLIQRLGPEAAEYFETDKVVLGVGGMYKTTKSLSKNIGAYLSFKDEKV